MIRVSFVEPATPEWVKSKRAAEAAIARLCGTVRKGARPKISDSLYKRLGRQMFKAFCGKCAYCETKFVLDQTGDVDHFRPKAAVTDALDRPVQIALAAKGKRRKPHPGYYWLAYRWENLLPTCYKCNRPLRVGDKIFGKSTRFPVVGQHAWKPGTETSEKPLFIHPIFDNPHEHLRLNARNGVLVAKTPRGKACIELLGLNREGLPEERARRYTEVQARVQAALNALGYARKSSFADALKVLLAYSRGAEAFSLAGRMALGEARKKYRPIHQLVDILEATST